MVIALLLNVLEEIGSPQKSQLRYGHGDTKKNLIREFGRIVP